MHRIRLIPFFALAIAASLETGCAPHDASGSQDAPADTPRASSTPAPSGDAASPASTASPAEATPAPSSLDDATPPPPRESLPEPQTPVAESSPQAAATVTETYFALLQAGKTTEADALWRDTSRATSFRAQFDALGHPQVEVDAPGGMEGAAGSSYVTVPVRFIPPATAANPRPRHGEVLLRRVNDVPGSTDEQRRWHIDRIDVAMTPK